MALEVSIAVKTLVKTLVLSFILSLPFAAQGKALCSSTLAPQAPTETSRLEQLNTLYTNYGLEPFSIQEDGLYLGQDKVEAPIDYNYVESLLGVEIDSLQAEAIAFAHLVGYGEIGTDGGPAAVENYTLAQITRKFRILKTAGFDRQQIQTLMDKEIVGFKFFEAIESMMDKVDLAIDKMLNPEEYNSGSSASSSNTKLVDGKTYKIDGLQLRYHKGILYLNNQPYSEVIGTKNGRIQHKPFFTQASSTHRQQGQRQRAQAPVAPQDNSWAYRELGITKNTSKSAARSAYRSLIVANHPDKFTDASQKARANEKSKRITNAWSIVQNERGWK